MFGCHTRESSQTYRYNEHFIKKRQYYLCEPACFLSLFFFGSMIASSSNNEQKSAKKRTERTFHAEKCVIHYGDIGKTKACSAHTTSKKRGKFLITYWMSVYDACVCVYALKYGSLVSTTS